MQNRIRLDNEEGVPLVLVLYQFCANAPFHCTPLLCLHLVIFGLTSTGWLRRIALTFTYYIICDSNIVFLFTPVVFTPIFSNLD